MCVTRAVGSERAKVGLAADAAGLRVPGGRGLRCEVILLRVCTRASRWPRARRGDSGQASARASGAVLVCGTRRCVVGKCGGAVALSPLALTCCWVQTCWLQTVSDTLQSPRARGDATTRRRETRRQRQAERRETGLRLTAKPSAERTAGPRRHATPARPAGGALLSKKLCNKSKRGHSRENL